MSMNARTTRRVESQELLDKLAAWLDQAEREGERLTRDGTREAGPGPDVELRGVGLYQLFEEFTALRHEVKLQTKGVRAAQDAFEATEGTLRKAIDHFQAARADEEQAAWRGGKPLAEALVELDEALRRTGSVINQAKVTLIEDAARAVDEAIEAAYARQSWWARRMTRGYHAQAREVFRTNALEARSAFFTTLVEGYGLVLKRLDRALKAEQVQPVACVGRPVDPETMTVVEVVDDPERAPGTVVDEVRRGYTWRGKLLRFAEVRAVKGATLP